MLTPLFDTCRSIGKQPMENGPTKSTKWHSGLWAVMDVVAGGAGEGLTESR